MIDMHLRGRDRVQEAAARGDALAVIELGRRYAVEMTQFKTEKHRERIARQYVRGWHGEANPYDYGRGGNFAAPLRMAYRDGKRDGEHYKAVLVRVEAARRTP